MTDIRVYYACFTENCKHYIPGDVFETDGTSIVHCEAKFAHLKEHTVAGTDKRVIECLTKEEK